MKEKFRKASNRISIAAGSATAFLGSVLIIVVWAATGSLFNYSDTWQLVINTGTTIVTFLMVFLIQNTQNRDSKAIHLKLDELIRSTKSARNAFVDLDNFTDEDLELLDREFKEAHTELQDNATIRRLRKKIAEEKTRRYSVMGAGAAIKSMLQTPIPGLNRDKDESKKK